MIVVVNVFNDEILYNLIFNVYVNVLVIVILICKLVYELGFLVIIIVFNCCLVILFCLNSWLIVGINCIEWFCLEFVVILVKILLFCINVIDNGWFDVLMSSEFMDNCFFNLFIMFFLCE